MSPINSINISVSAEPLSDDEKVVNDIFQFLMLKDAKPTITRKLLKTLLIKRDPEFFKIASKFASTIFANIFEQIQQSNDEHFKNKCEIVIGNLVAILPFLNLEHVESQKIEIPQKIDNNWEMVEFKIGRTPLHTNLFFGEAIDILELDPINNTNARPIRAFQGTTFPAGKGMVQTLLADLFPFSSVGELFLKLSPKAFEKSLAGVENVDLYGQSLGGATAMLVSLAHKSKVHSVTTFGAPKLYSWTINKYLKNGVAPDHKITAYVNENDSVFKAGNALPKGTEVIELCGDKSHHPAEAHPKIVAAQRNVSMTNLSEEKVNRWTVTAIIHLILAPVLFIAIAAVYLLARLLITTFYTLPKLAFHSVFSKSKKKVESIV